MLISRKKKKNGNDKDVNAKQKKKEDPGDTEEKPIIMDVTDFRPSPFDGLINFISNETLVSKTLPGWGLAWVMLVIIISFLLFLIIILQIYNSSIILDSMNVNWM